MTTFKKVLLGCIGAYMFAALPLAYADNPGTDGLPRVHAGQRIREIYSQLHLTDEQKKELEANKQQHRAIMERARQEMKVSKEALQDALMRPQLDMPRINELHGKIKALLAQEEDNKLNSILEVRTILTPEQFTRFVNLMHRHKQEHGE